MYPSTQRWASELAMNKVQRAPDEAGDGDSASSRKRSSSVSFFLNGPAHVQPDGSDETKQATARNGSGTAPQAEAGTAPAPAAVPVTVTTAVPSIKFSVAAGIAAAIVGLFHRSFVSRGTVGTGSPECVLSRVRGLLAGAGV